MRGGATPHALGVSVCLCSSRVATVGTGLMDDPAKPRGGDAARPEDAAKDAKDKEKPKRPDDEDLSVLPIIDRSVRSGCPLSLTRTSSDSYSCGPPTASP